MDFIYCYVDLLGVRMKAFVERNDANAVKGSPIGGIIKVHFKQIHETAKVEAPIVEVIQPVAEPVKAEVIKKGGKKK